MSTTTELSLLTPENVCVFIVGQNSDWDGDERHLHGDVGLERALRQCCCCCCCQSCVVFCKDLSLDDTQKQFVQLLQQSTTNDTLLFYYGGHGVAQGFCFKNENDNYEEVIWSHQQVLQLVETYFRGHTVVWLIDCCYSGKFSLSLRQHSTTISSHLALMSTLPNESAGPDWTLTKCVIQALEGNVTNSKVDCDEHDGTTIITVRDLVEYMADEILFVKGDLLTVYAVGNNVIRPDCPFFTGAGRQRQEDDNNSSISFDSTHEWEEKTYYNRGDCVYYRWKGGRVITSTNNNGPTCYIYPSWLPARIVQQQQQDTVVDDHDSNSDPLLYCLEITAPVYDISWRITRARTCDMRSRRCWERTLVKLCCDMAHHGMFLDIPLLETSTTRLNVLWHDGKIYEAESMAWSDLSQKEIAVMLSQDIVPCGDDDDDDGDYLHGGYVAVWWPDESSYSIVSTSHFVVRDCRNESRLNEATVKERIQRQICRYSRRQGASSASSSEASASWIVDPRNALFMSLGALLCSNAS